MRLSYYIIFFVFITLEGAAQNRPYPESYNKIAETYKTLIASDIDSTLDFLLDIELSANKDLEMLVTKMKAEVSIRKGEFQLADSLLQQVIPYLEASAFRLELLQAWQSIIGIYFRQGRLKEGIVFGVKATQYIEENSSRLTESAIQLAIGDINKNIGILYAVQADSKPSGFEIDQATAKRYFRKALSIYENEEALELQATALFNLGAASSILDSITFYYQKAGEIYGRLNLPYRKADISLNLGILYITDQQFEKALSYLNEANKSIKRPDPFNEALIYIKLGRVHLRLGDLKKAIDYIQLALPIVESNDFHRIEIEAYEILIPSLYGQGEFMRALDSYVIYDTLSKRARFEEVEQITREIETQYKTKEQQDRIQILEQEEALRNAQLKQQQLAIGISAAIAVIGVILGYFLWKQNKQKAIINKNLKKLDETRTRFLANISHELRTPVTLIQAPLEDAIEHLEKDNLDRVSSNLKKVYNNARKLSELTEEVLDISKLDEGSLKLIPHPTNIKAFIDLKFYAFESLGVRNNLKWEIKNDLSETAYYVDRNKLEKIINNLLSNAIKYTPKGGEVSLFTHMQDGVLHLSVKDTGNGIPENLTKKIFERYYQVADGDKTLDGIGIGLALTKELIEFMGGSISVVSEPTIGSTFFIELPLEESSEAMRQDNDNEKYDLELENRPAIDLTDDNQPHILVVEDNLEMADFIQTLLSDQYRVTLANNGIEGIDRLKSGTFDLITADVMMPEMGGHEFVQQIKSHTNWKQTPLIMITALADDADKVKGLQLGIDDYIPKPFNTSELKVRVSNLLQNALVRKNTLQESEEDHIGNEEETINRTKELVESRIADNSLTVKDLADLLSLSERQANRVIKRLTGLSCLQFIREIRLQRAYRLLESRKYQTIAEVAFAVGFENASYFTRIFNERFGKKPSQLL